MELASLRPFTSYPHLPPLPARALPLPRRPDMPPAHVHHPCSTVPSYPAHAPCISSHAAHPLVRESYAASSPQQCALQRMLDEADTILGNLNDVALFANSLCSNIAALPPNIDPGPCLPQPSHFKHVASKAYSILQSVLAIQSALEKKGFQASLSIPRVHIVPQLSAAPPANTKASSPIYDGENSLLHTHASTTYPQVSPPSAWNEKTMPIDLQLKRSAIAAESASLTSSSHFPRDDPEWQTTGEHDQTVSGITTKHHSVNNQQADYIRSTPTSVYHPASTIIATTSITPLTYCSDIHTMAQGVTQASKYQCKNHEDKSNKRKRLNDQEMNQHRLVSNLEHRTRQTKRTGPLPEGRCHSCNATDTPEWRRGPDGKSTLCNACGLHWAKLRRQKQQEMDKTINNTVTNIANDSDRSALLSSTLTPSELLLQPPPYCIEACYVDKS